MIPLRTATEYANKIIRARVAAAACAGCSRSTPRSASPRSSPRPRPPAPTCTTRAPAWSFEPGLLTAIVSEQPDDSAELADRLGMTASPVDDEVTLGGVPLTSLSPGRGAPPHPGLRHRRDCSSPGGSAPAQRHRPRRGRAGRSTPRRAERHPRGAARGSRRDRRRARPELLRRPAAAAGAGAGAVGRPGDPGAGRADLGGRRAHRGPDRRSAAAPTAPAARPSSPRPAR